MVYCIFLVLCLRLYNSIPKFPGSKGDKGFPWTSKNRKIINSHSVMNNHKIRMLTDDVQSQKLSDVIHSICCQDQAGEMKLQNTQLICIDLQLLGTYYLTIYLSPM